MKINSSNPFMLPTLNSNNAFTINMKRKFESSDEDDEEYINPEEENKEKSKKL